MARSSGAGNVGGTGVKKVSIDITAKTDAAASAIARVSEQYKAMTHQQSQAAKGGAATAGQMDKLTAKFEGMQASLGKVTNLLGAAGLVGVAVGAVKVFDEMVGTLGKYQTVMANVPYSIDQATRATGGLVAQMDLAKAAIAANRLGVAQTSEEFEKIARIGSKLALSVGDTAASGVEDLTTALARQSPMILDNLGITVKLEEAQEKYAKKLGKTAEALTEAEKKQAFVNEALEKGEKAAAAAVIRYDSFPAMWQRMKVGAEEAGMATLQFAEDMIFAQRRVEDLARATENAAANIEALDNAMRISGAQLERRDEMLIGFEQYGATVPFGQAPMASGPKRPEKKERRRGGGGRRGAKQEEDLLGGAAMENATALDELQQAWAEEEEATREHERRMAEITLEERQRAVDERAARGLDPAAVFEQRVAAEEEYLALRERHSEYILDTEDRELEQAQIRNDREQMLHEQRMTRTKAEGESRKQLAAAYKRFAIASAQALMMASVAAVTAGRESRRAFFESVRAFAKTMALEMGLKAISEFTQAAIAAASYRYAEAGQHIQAGGMALSAATVAAGVAAGANAIAGGGGRGGGGRGMYTPGPANGGGYGGGGYGSDRDTGGVPRAYKPPQPPQQPPGKGGGGGVTVVVNGIVAATQEDLGHHIRKALRAADNKLGGVR